VIEDYGTADNREGLKVLTEDEIWAAVEEVWMSLPKCKIASG